MHEMSLSNQCITMLKMAARLAVFLSEITAEGAHSAKEGEGISSAVQISIELKEGGQIFKGTDALHPLPAPSPPERNIDSLVIVILRIIISTISEN